MALCFQAPTWLKNELKEGIIPGGQGQDDSEDDSDSEEADSETEETDTGKMLLLLRIASMALLRSFCNQRRFGWVN